MKQCLILMIIFVFICLLGCSNETKYENMMEEQSENEMIIKNEYMNDNMKNDTQLIVEGQTVVSENIKIDYEKKYAIIPFLAVLKELNADVEWENDSMVRIVFDDNLYILDTGTYVFTKENSQFNMIIEPPGTRHNPYYYSTGNEFYIDTDAAKYFIMQLGARINIDYDESIIYIYHFK